MAIDYTLALGTSLPASEVARELHEAARDLDVIDPSVTLDVLLDPGTVTTAGTWMRVVEAKPSPWNPVAEDLGFVPTVRVVFEPDKTVDHSAQQDDMIRLVSELLARIPGNSVLHSGYEQIWLLRRDGDLSVNERTDMWPPARLALLTQPYRRATHTFA